MKFDRALFNIKNSTRFKWAITFNAKYFKENPPEKIDSYPREKERSLGKKENDNSIYDNNGDDTRNIKKKKKKKKTSHNIIMFSLMPNNNYLLSPSVYLLFFVKLLVVSRFL